MIRRQRGASLILAGLLAGAGCGAGTGGAAGEPALVDAEPSRRDLSLEVRNLNFYDAELYAVDEGYRVRIGSIRGNETKTFAFRWLPARDLRIEIRLLAVGTYLSDRLLVNEGDEVLLIIEPDLHRRQPLPRRPESGESERGDESGVPPGGIAARVQRVPFKYPSRLV